MKLMRLFWLKNFMFHHWWINWISVAETLYITIYPTTSCGNKNQIIADYIWHVVHSFFLKWQLFYALCVWFVGYMVRYIAIVKEEGLEISQPALDPGKSEIYHPLTARIPGSKVHRLTSTSLLSIIYECSARRMN